MAQTEDSVEFMGSSCTPHIRCTSIAVSFNITLRLNPCSYRNTVYALSMKAAAVLL